MLWFIGTRVGYERDWSCGFSAEKSVWRRVWGKIKCKGKTTPGLKKSAARVSFNSSVVRFINKVVHSLEKKCAYSKIEYYFKANKGHQMLRIDVLIGRITQNFINEAGSSHNSNQKPRKVIITHNPYSITLI